MRSARFGESGQVNQVRLGHQTAGDDTRGLDSHIVAQTRGGLFFEFSDGKLVQEVTHRVDCPYQNLKREPTGKQAWTSRLKWTGLKVRAG